MIKLSHVDVDFGSVQAVKDVSLSVQEGEIYGIIGYSGAGKSTLVRTINLLQPPTKGEIEVNGQQLTKLSPKALRQARKKIGMIFQHFNLMESRSVYENVAFPLRDSSLSAAEKRKKVEELVEYVGLGDRLNAYPSQLSGGQKQRVAIARALANDPAVLLCDEATSALDPKTTASILELLKRVNRQLNITIVVITHEMAVVKELCQRVAIMEEGRIIEEGSIVDMFTQPESKLAQEFINTATRLDQELQIVLEHPTTEHFVEAGQLLHIEYVGSQTTQPLISRLVEEYNLKVNILYGHVEILQDTPVGNLLIAVEGSQKDIERTKVALQTQGVRVQTQEELLASVNIEGVM